MGIDMDIKAVVRLSFSGSIVRKALDADASTRARLYSVQILRIGVRAKQSAILFAGRLV
jgi:hypothetical protein